MVHFRFLKTCSDCLENWHGGTLEHAEQHKNISKYIQRSHKMLLPVKGQIFKYFQKIIKNQGKVLELFYKHR